MSKHKRVLAGILLVAILIALIGLHRIWVWTELEIVGTAFLSSQYQNDAYLECIVLFKNIPMRLAKYLAPLVRIKEFSFYDESGQFRYNDELYGVVSQLRQINVLEAMPGEDRIVVDLLGQNLAQVGIESVDDSNAGGFIFMYYGVSYTGNDASTGITGPNTLKLVYSVFGINRTTTRTST